MKKFNLKNEGIFLTLASHAARILEKEKDSVNPELRSIAVAISTHFKKKTKRYTKKRALNLTNYLKDTVGPAFDTKLSPVLMMLSSMVYLFNEGHEETKICFAGLRLKVFAIVDFLELSEDFKKEYFNSNDIILNMLGGGKLGFELNPDMIKAHTKNQYNLLYMLTILLKDQEDFYKVYNIDKDVITNILSNVPDDGYEMYSDKEAVNQTLIQIDSTGIILNDYSLLVCLLHRVTIFNTHRVDAIVKIADYISPYFVKFSNLKSAYNNNKYEMHNINNILNNTEEKLT